MPTITYVRANLHDVTAAISRAMEAGSTSFQKIRILCWNRTGQSLPRYQTCGDVEIERFEAHPPPRSIKTAVAVAKFQWWVFRRLLSSSQDLVQVCDLESAIPAAVLTLFRRTRLIYDMRDPFADSFSLPRWARTLAYSVDYLTMASASGFVVPATERVPYLGRWARHRPVCVVRNTCFDELGRIEEEVRSASTHPREDRISIAFLGYIVETRGARWLVDLCTQSPDRYELFAAGSCRSAGTKERLSASPGVRWFGRVTRPSALSLMRQSDVVALLYDPTIPVNRLAAPNKFYEALMTGTPVLVSRGMSLEREVEEAGIGFVVDYGDSDGLRRALDRLSDPTEATRIRERCREYFLNQCSLERDLQDYREFYQRFS